MLKELIYASGYNFHSFSKKIDVPMTTIRNIHERNSLMNTNLCVVIKIAHGLNLSVEELIEKMKG